MSIRIALGAVTALGCIAAAGTGQAQPINHSAFHLLPNPIFESCIEQQSQVPPVAKVTVKRGLLNDTLTINVSGLKANLKFDVFTVQRSNLKPSGLSDPNFPGFGLAWYQSELQANADGLASATIKTKLLDEIFGFDPDAGIALAPTNTFHVGFWFDDPNDAAPCGFNASNPTPFNGEHKAGPVAMISVPDKTTKLGPLCLNPNTSTNPATCTP